MYRFRMSIHGRPANAENGPEIPLRGRAVAALDVPRDVPPMPLGVSFEEAVEALSELPRMFIEPDGAFVWVSSNEDSPWQVDGVLYDRAGRVMYVEAKGNCPEEDIDRLLSTLGWPASELMFQLVPEAVFLGERAFRGYAVT